MTTGSCEHGVASNQVCQSCLDDFQANFHIMRNQTDMVNRPAHYTHGGIEAIEYIQAKLTSEEFAGYCKGNALKYISRAGHKADATEDYRKAVWYLNRLIKD
jgi:hypothetical protein